MDEGKEMVKALEDLIKYLKTQDEIEVTEVKVENTPDGPLHTFEKKRIINPWRQGKK